MLVFLALAGRLWSTSLYDGKSRRVCCAVMQCQIIVIVHIIRSRTIILYRVSYVWNAYN